MVPQNVLHITNNYPTIKYPIYGIFVKEQIDSLTNYRIKNNVFFINGREKGKIEYLKSVFKIRSYLKRHPIDIIHCHHALSAIFLLIGTSRKKQKIVVSFQNDPDFEMGKQAFNYISNRVNALIFKNKSHYINGNSTFYVPNGVNTEFFRFFDKKEACLRLGLNPDFKYILFVSSNMIRKQKRFDRFQKVMELLVKEYGQNVRAIKLVNVERQFVPYYMNAADVHLLSSDFEGSPNSVKECMACNTSVVSTDVGNVGELLRNVSGSYVAKTKKASELAMLVSKSLLFAGEKNGRSSLIQQKLDIDSVAKKIVDIYTNLK